MGQSKKDSGFNVNGPKTLKTLKTQMNKENSKEKEISRDIKYVNYNKKKGTGGGEEK